MSNRVLLAIVVGLGSLSCLFCLIVVYRENSNAATSAALKTFTAQRQDEADQQITSLKSALAQTRTDLDNTSKALEGIRKQVTETQDDLGKARKALAKAEETIESYRKLPWLNGQPSSNAPWTSELKRLADELDRVKKKLAMLPKS